MENNEPIDFKRIPVAVKLSIAKRKVVAMQSQIDMWQSMHKERVNEVINLKDEKADLLKTNNDLLKSNVALHKHIQELEAKVQFLQKNNQPTKDDILKIKKSELYKELVVNINSKIKKNKALKKKNMELVDVIRQLRRKYES